MKRTKEWMSLSALLVLTLLAACERREAEPAPAGALPEVTGKEVTGKLLGPQPGPDRPIPKANNPFPMEQNVLTEGRRLFVWYNCYGCHGGRAGGGMGPSLRDETWLYGGKDQDIYNSIAEGRPHGMPAWGPKLPQEQIWKLTAYIQSLGTPLEPKKPPENPVMPTTGS
ncbi:c-type cytochrome [Proteobacteria bacterium 005FR1]|nr:c-type cytochrome [Proteobacteria bacterium 005FR1]